MENFYAILEAHWTVSDSDPYFGDTDDTEEPEDGARAASDSAPVDLSKSSEVVAVDLTNCSDTLPTPERPSVGAEQLGDTLEDSPWSAEPRRVESPDSQPQDSPWHATPMSGQNSTSMPPPAVPSKKRSPDQHQQALYPFEDGLPREEVERRVRARIFEIKYPGCSV